MGGFIGVDIFIIISGYFLIEKEAIDIKKIVRLITSILFYSVIFFAIYCTIAKNSFTINGLLNSLLAVSSGEYWFLTFYILLYLISPYINKVLNNLSKKEWDKIIIVSTVIISMYPTFVGTNFNLDKFPLFIYLYVIGAYIKTHSIELLAKMSFIKNFIFALTLYILTFILVYLANRFQFNINILGYNIFYFNYSSSFCILLLYYCSLLLTNFLFQAPL